MASPQPDRYTKLSNELLEALIKHRLSGRELRVFLAIARRTYGWSKKADQITFAELSIMTCLGRSHVANIVRNLSDRNMILRNGVTGIQKDYELWALPKTVTPHKCTYVTENGNKSVTENGNKVLPKTVTPLLVKEMKEKKERADKPLTAHQKFVKNFSEVYAKRSGQPFKTDKVCFITAAKLITDYTLEACIEKAKILESLCADGVVWPAKNGWADFTIANLSRNWNSIISRPDSNGMTPAVQRLIDMTKKGPVNAS